MKKRSDGRYSTSVTIGHDQDGKPIKKYIYAKSKSELKAKVEAIQFSPMSSKDYGFTEYAWIWQQTFKPGKQAYTNIIRNHLHGLNRMKLKDVTRTDIQQAVNDERGHYDIQRRLKQTVNMILENAVLDRLISVNPCKGIVVDQKPKTSRNRLTERQESDVLNASLPPRTKMLLMICYYTGARRGEALALSFDDIKDGYISITKSLAHDGEVPYIKETKTDSGVRKIPIASQLIQHLKEYIEVCEHEYLFANKYGELPRKTTVSRMVEQIKRETGITPHYLRHNYATRLYEAGVDFKTAQYLMGHSTTKMLLEVYAHPDIPEIDMDKIFD